jgi:hypothetical protein
MNKLQKIIIREKEINRRRKKSQAHIVVYKTSRAITGND